MRDNYEKILRLACLALGAFLLYECAALFLRRDVMSHLNIPALPSLAAVADGKGTNSSSAADAPKKGTNAAAVASSRGTNPPPSDPDKKAGTNPAVSMKMENHGTNSAPPEPSSKETNNPIRETIIEDEAPAVAAPRKPKNKGTNSTSVKAASLSDTNSSVPASATNVSAVSIALKSGKEGTNSVTMAMVSTNGTNAAPGNHSTNAASASLDARKRVSGSTGRTGSDSGKKPAELPPKIQARVDRITQSGVFGQMMPPPPMALLGIAGKSAFLRAPNGQSGAVKEGDELGGVKLLRIGINRVLVEEEGEKKELMIFSGLGGESLMPKQQESTNETIKKP